MAAKTFRDPAADDLASHDAARPGFATCPLCRRLRPPHGPQHWPPRARWPLLRGLVHPSLAGGLLCPSWTGQHFMGLCVFVRISKGMSEPRFAWASLVQGPVRADTLPLVTPPRRPLRRGRGWRGLRHAVSLPEPQEAVARSSPDDWTGEAVKVSFASPPRRKAGAGRGFWGSRTGQGRCSRSAAEGQAEVSH